MSIGVEVQLCRISDVGFRSSGTGEPSLQVDLRSAVHLRPSFEVDGRRVTTDRGRSLPVQEQALLRRLFLGGSVDDLGYRLNLIQDLLDRPGVSAAIS